MQKNPILEVDSYKMGHFRQYPKDTQKLSGYLESRYGRYPKTLFVGLQGLIKEKLSTPITMANVEDAAALAKAHGEPFPYDGWKYIVDKYKGYLPVKIRAVKEGSLVPISNALLTMKSTDPKVPWIVGWLETQIMRLWFPITVATRSFYCKKIIRSYLDKTSDNTDAEIQFKLHDFGSRGTSSGESAEIGGMAHLVNFMGTDTISALPYINDNYGAFCAGLSIPAMEHSTVTAWGKENEAEAYKNFIESNPEYPVLAAVSDSYDIYNAVENIWCGSLLDYVKASGKTIVVRPDSGDPSTVNLELLRIFEKKIGMTKNSKGYKVLPSFYRLIQGDGNNTEMDIDRVLGVLALHGYSASNIAFGMGGGLLQKLDRDTNGFAFKLSIIVRDGKACGVSKSPKGDSSKKSKSGHLELIINSKGEYETIDINKEKLVDPAGYQFVTYYDNGPTDYTDTFENIRKRAKEALDKEI